MTPKIFETGIYAQHGMGTTIETKKVNGSGLIQRGFVILTSAGIMENPMEEHMKIVQKYTEEWVELGMMSHVIAEWPPFVKLVMQLMLLANLVNIIFVFGFLAIRLRIEPVNQVHLSHKNL